MLERERIWTKASLCKISSQRQRSVSPARCQVAASPRDDPANISLAADGRKIPPRLGHNPERDAHPLKYFSTPQLVCFSFDPCAPRANVTTAVSLYCPRIIVWSRLFMFWRPVVCQTSEMYGSVIHSERCAKSKSFPTNFREISHGHCHSVI